MRRDVLLLTEMIEAAEQAQALTSVLHARGLSTYNLVSIIRLQI